MKIRAAGKSYTPACSFCYCLLLFNISFQNESCKPRSLHRISIIEHVRISAVAIWYLRAADRLHLQHTCDQQDDEIAMKNEKNTLLLMHPTCKSEIIRVVESAVQLQRDTTLHARQTPFC